MVYTCLLTVDSQSQDSKIPSFITWFISFYHLSSENDIFPHADCSVTEHFWGFIFNVTTVRKEVNHVETWSDLWLGNETMLPSHNFINVTHNSKYSVKHLYNWVPLRTEAEGKCKIAIKLCILYIIFRHFCKKKTTNYQFPLKIAKISLQKQNFPGIRFPNSTSSTRSNFFVFLI